MSFEDSRIFMRAGDPAPEMAMPPRRPLTGSVAYANVGAL